MIPHYTKQCPVRDNPEFNSGLVEKRVSAEPESRRDDILLYGKISNIGKMLRTYGTLFCPRQSVFYQYLIPNGIKINNLNPLHLNPLAEANGNKL